MSEQAVIYQPPAGGGLNFRGRGAAPSEQQAEPLQWHRMLTPPVISNQGIGSCLYENFGLRTNEVTFLPLGADEHSAVYRVSADDHGTYLLKLRKKNFNPAGAKVPAFLRSRGIASVMAPLETISNHLWVHAHGFNWMLYPFFEGKTGFQIPLSRAQWIALGETLRCVHNQILPPDLGRLVPRESFSPRNRAAVRALDARAHQRKFDDAPAASFADFWKRKADDIRRIVEGVEHLSKEIQRRHISFAVCHSDLHAGNVLLGTSGELAIIDWDDIILAPKERDLMFIGGGVGGIWNDPREAQWFYSRYGPTEIDKVAIAYYRYERIVADLVAYGERILDSAGSIEDRELGVRKVAAAFLPNDVVEIAHRTYAALG